jgi:hypothetical protein
MSISGALTNGEVQDLVYTWFHSLNNKIDLNDMLSLLSSDELEMRFPETTIRNVGDFTRWYEGVKNLYFDQRHELKMLAVDLDGTQARVTLVVNWCARTWKSPAAYSKLQQSTIHQTWVVKREPRSGKAVISSYYVGHFDPVQAQP